MCGIVGLFIGCPATAVCPKHLVSAADGELRYRSCFDRWDERASVRCAPRRTLESNDAATLLFPPDLVPLARHPSVRALEPELFEQVLTQHLYRYLDFTAKLEHLVVNRTVQSIAEATVGVHVPEDMRFDAYRIHCDEAFHCLFSVDMMRQVRVRTGIEPRLERRPYFLRRLDEMKERVGDPLAAVLELLFVVCSETLITATLAEFPDDPSVDTGVRDTIRDHASDEARHHAYFAAFLRYLWHDMDPRMRRRSGRLVPELIDAFLRPDVEVVRAELAGYGFGEDEAEQIVSEVFAEDVIRAHVAATARRTVSYFAAVGVLDDEVARARFEERGLLLALEGRPPS
jgi:hypothetical protein